MRKVIVGIVLLLCVGVNPIGAEVIRHSFHAMSGNGTIAYSVSNTVGTTDFVTYTCTGGAFGVTGSVIAICLTETNSYVVISPALNNVQSFKVVTTSDLTDISSSVKVYISEDGSTWSSALTDISILMKGAMQVNIPAGYYFLKVQNTKATDIFITSVEYTFDACDDCFTYEN